MKKILAFSRVLFSVSPILILPEVCHAYTGPGMALGSVLAVLSILGGLLLLVFGSLWYPFKRLLSKRKIAEVATKTGATEN